jgi:hypothetical protein
LGTVFLSATSTLTSAVMLTGSAALIMGGTGIPDPTAFPNYVPNVTSYYIAPNTSCKIGSCQLVPAITPEQLFPFIGLMTYDQSVAAGVVDLDRIGPCAWSTA